MKSIRRYVVGALCTVLLVSTAGCSSFDGTVGETHKSFKDEYGRVCTIVKWGETGGIDCDWPQSGVN